MSPVHLRHLLVLIPFLWSCSSSVQDVAGRPGGDETGNGLTAQVVDRQGLPVAGAQIHIRPLSWLDCDTCSTNSTDRGILDLRTDTNGSLRLDRLPRGTYHLEIRNADQGVLETFEVDSLSQLPRQLQLQPLGSVSGHVSLEHPMPARVRIWGVPGHVQTDSVGIFRMDTVAPGDFRLVVTNPEDSILGEAKVSVFPGLSTATTAKAMPPDPRTWDRHAKLVVDASQLDLGSTEVLHAFPFLIRLDSTNFPFAQARNDGSDLSLTTSEGNAVPLEVSNWDPYARKGLAWFRLDSMRCDGKVSLRLAWGEASKPLGNVFDTAHGWSGVWHLSNTTLTSQGQRLTPDASTARRDGNLRQAGTSQGTLAHSILFSTPADRMVIPGQGIALGQHDYTWETWLQVSQGNVILMERSDGDTVWEKGEKRILLGDRRYGLHGTGPGLVPSSLSRINSSTNLYANFSGELTAGTWIHLALCQTRTGNDSVSVRWYVNGIPDTVQSPPFLAETDDPSDSLRVAFCPPGGSLAMEELRLSRVARSSAWIRMSWETQRPDSPVARILPP